MNNRVTVPTTNVNLHFPPAHQFFFLRASSSSSSYRVVKVLGGVLLFLFGIPCLPWLSDKSCGPKRIAVQVPVLARIEDLRVAGGEFTYNFICK